MGVRGLWPLFSCVLGESLHIRWGPDQLRFRGTKIGVDVSVWLYEIINCGQSRQLWDYLVKGEVSWIADAVLGRAVEIIDKWQATVGV